MKKFAIAAMLLAALTVSGCSNSGRFGNDAATGAPGSASDPTSPAYFSQTIGDRVHFAVDQSTLSPQAQQILTKQATWLTDNPEFSAIIEGHADEQGTREYNIALGARRASAVQGFLIDHGVAPNRLKTISYGKERPIAVCSDESCYAQNRRAVTVLTSGGSMVATTGTGLPGSS